MPWAEDKTDLCLEEAGPWAGSCQRGARLWSTGYCLLSGMGDQVSRTIAFISSGQFSK